MSQKAVTKRLRKVLEKQIIQLNDAIADIDMVLTELETNFYRVCIFGSARIKPETELYKQAYSLAYELSMLGSDIVTGGGPGLMEAANKGAKDGSERTRSIGLPIELPFESDANSHLDVKRHHRRFSSRLDEFMRMTHAVIVTPGGIGTILELYYTWQLIQVKHIKPRPIILLGKDKMWSELISWMKKWPLGSELMSESDFDGIYVCETVEEVVKLLQPQIAEFEDNRLKLKNKSKK